MRFVEVATLSTESILACDADASEEELAARCSFDLMALVYFPSSRAFVDAWSDPELVRGAYPLREALLADGFQHVWLRCEEG